MFEKLKKNALLAIMILVTLLAGASLAVSIYVFRVQNDIIDSVLDAYVVDIAETYAEYHTQGTFNPPRPMHGRMMMRPVSDDLHHTPRGRAFFRMFSADPSLRSGGLLLLNKAGKAIGGSDGAEALVSLWHKKITFDVPIERVGQDGTSYRVVAKRLDDGKFLLVAASKKNLLSSLSGIWNFWLISVMLTTAAVLVGIIALWRTFVLPVRHIVEAVGHNRWGEEVPAFPPSCLYEVNELERVIEQSAESAIAKETLRARYVMDIVQATEDAQNRLARELHDGPLQSVVAAIKRIQLAQSVAAPETRERLDEAERISQYAANEIRNYCDELSPSWVALGISSALEELADRLSMTHGIRIAVRVDEMTCDLSDDCALSLIRIMQEAVSNAVRHGGATAVDVALAGEAGELLYTITDNGEGCAEVPPDFERMRLEGHRGLSNMRERVSLLGGTLAIERASRHAPYGCRVTVRLRLCAY